MFNHPDSCREHEPSHFDWIMACPGCIDEAKKQLTAKDARIAELEALHPFIKYMIDEIEANKTRKGVWQEWEAENYTVWTKEIQYHLEKLKNAFETTDNTKILEYCADIANLAYFTAVNSEALQSNPQAGESNE